MASHTNGNSSENPKEQDVPRRFPPKGKPFRGNRGKQSSQRRQDDHRRKVSEPFVKQLQEDLKKRCFADYSLPLPDLKTSTMVAKNTSQLMVSTRGVGAATSRVFTSIASQYRQKAAAICTVHQAFRCCLLQATLKLQRARETTPHASLSGSENDFIFLEPAIVSIVESSTKSFNLVSNVLSGIGWMDVTGDTFVTCVRSGDLNHSRWLSMTALTLRELVELSRNGTSITRRLFRALNTIPGCDYDDHNRLINVDEVCPPDWLANPARSFADFNAFNALLSFVEGKMPWLVGRVTYDGKAFPHALINRTISRDTAGSVIPNGQDSYFTIDPDVRWYSRRTLDEGVYVRGALSLLGELYVIRGDHRQQRDAVTSTTLDWNFFASKTQERV